LVDARTHALGGAASIDRFRYVEAGGAAPADLHPSRVTPGAWVGEIMLFGAGPRFGIG
jgi:hypothetical protein